MINFDIRIGTPGDLEVIQALNAGLYEYENGLGFFQDSYDLGWTYNEAGTKYFSSLLNSSNPESIAFLASIKDEPIGYLAASLASLTYRSKKPIAEIDNMFVIEAHRHSGCGSALVEQFLQWARTNNAQRAKVGAFAGNSAGDFYHKCGFTEAEIIFEMALDV